MANLTARRPSQKRNQLLNRLSEAPPALIMALLHKKARASLHLRLSINSIKSRLWQLRSKRSRQSSWTEATASALKPNRLSRHNRPSKLSMPNPLNPPASPRTSVLHLQTHLLQHHQRHGPHRQLGPGSVSAKAIPWTCDNACCPFAGLVILPNCTTTSTRSVRVHLVVSSLPTRLEPTTVWP